jgi:DNA-binding NarL/FixJ family response regulator
VVTSSTVEVTDDGAAPLRRPAGGEPVDYHDNGSGLAGLRERIRAVGGTLTVGPGVAQIAARLFLGDGTVRNYLSSAIGKTGSRNQVEAVHVAEENGWL